MNTKSARRYCSISDFAYKTSARLQCEGIIHPPTVRDASASIATGSDRDEFPSHRRSRRSNRSADVTRYPASDHFSHSGRHRSPHPAVQRFRQAPEFSCGVAGRIIESEPTCARLYALCAATERNSFWQRRAHAAQEGPIAVPPKSSARIALPPNVCLSPAVRIVEVAVLSGNRVSRARALSHPDLEHPVAYLSGEPLAPLVGEAIGAKPVEQILCRWAMRMPIERARAIARWMYQVGILIRSAPG